MRNFHLFNYFFFYCWIASLLFQAILLNCRSSSSYNWSSLVHCQFKFKIIIIILKRSCEAVNLTVSSIFMPSLKRLFIFNIFSDDVISFNNTWKLPPLIWRYCPYLRSIGSLWNLLLKSKSSANKSSISVAWHNNVLWSASQVCLLKVKALQLTNLLSSHCFNHWQKNLKKSCLL